MSGFQSVLVKLAAWRLGSAGHALFMTKLVSLEHLLGSCVSPPREPRVGLLTLRKAACMEICVGAKL